MLIEIDHTLLVYVVWRSELELWFLEGMDEKCHFPLDTQFPNSGTQGHARSRLPTPIL